MKRLKHLTKYPKVYECYWGGFTEDSYYNNSNIIWNRDRFKEMKNLKNYYDKGMSVDKLRLGLFYDHQEAYKTTDNKLIFIVSPEKCQENYKYAIEHDFIIEEPLYSNRHITCSKTFDNIFEFNKWVKTL